MHLEPEAEWILPENIRRQQERERLAVDQGKFDGAGDLGSYYALRTGSNKEFVKLHGMTDVHQTLTYAKGVRLFLERSGIEVSGKTLLDVGCGIGALTEALRIVFKTNQAVGLDLAEDGILYACATYPECRFFCTSAEEALGLSPESFDIIHAREVYPVTRTSSIEYQVAFLGAMARLLKPGGIIVLEMVHLDRGLGYTWKKLGIFLAQHRLGPIDRNVMIHRRFVRLFGASAYGFFGYIFCCLMTRLLYQKRTGYFFSIRKCA
jgi:2-polyprenyl-3-methyl-5-hydroxy-6-metoxy-1,4-benzoquinol methylase